jgi:hypothetical protein
MDNSFDLPVTLNGKEYVFPASLISYGYSYKIEVNVFDTIVSFEPDEERSYRALIKLEEMQNVSKVSKEILQLIAEKLSSLFQW